MMLSDVSSEILVVDDVVANLELLRNILRNHGYRVRAVSSGKRALESARLSQPDMVLLDIMMPDMDGYETCRAFKMDPRLNEIPIIFISALDDALDKVKAFDCGGLDYIPKPFQEEEVIARVQNHLRIRELQKDLYEKNVNLEAALLQLQSLNEQKNRFLEIVAHDLRNPLAGIAMTAELALEEMDQNNDKLRKDMKRIIDASHSMAEMLTRFLDVNRIESGELRPIPEVLELNAFCRSRLERFRVIANGKQQCLELGGLESLYVSADPNFLREVVDNLISNAIKYSQKGKSIVVNLSMNHDFGVVSVVDQGPGFTEEDKKKIFGRFARLSAKPTGGEPSVGLGLSIAKQMVEAMDGKIVLESEAGCGATFRVLLPLATSGA